MEKYGFEETLKALQTVTEVKSNVSGSVINFKYKGQEYFVYNKLTSPKYCMQTTSFEALHCVVDNLYTLNQPADYKGGVVRKVFLKIISDSELRSWIQVVLEIENVASV